MLPSSPSLSEVVLYDTTLRDGGQTIGVDFSVLQKNDVARLIDRLGFGYVEAGWPGANPTDDAFFAAPPALSCAKLTAFGMTRRKGRKAEKDPQLNALLASPAQAVCLVGKSWREQAEVALGVTAEENLSMIRESLAAVKQAGKEALFDAEHFFDGFKRDETYALETLRAALEGGADSHAQVLVDGGGAERFAESAGEGPVHALDLALRQALLGTFPLLKGTKLVNFKVGLLSQTDGTAAQTHVEVASADASGATWTTTGVSRDIVKASLKALSDAYAYKLNLGRLKSGPAAVARAVTGAAPSNEKEILWDKAVSFS